MYTYYMSIKFVDLYQPLPPLMNRYNVQVEKKTRGPRSTVAAQMPIAQLKLAQTLDRNLASRSLGTPQKSRNLHI